MNELQALESIPQDELTPEQAKRLAQLRLQRQVGQAPGDLPQDTFGFGQLARNMMAPQAPRQQAMPQVYPDYPGQPIKPTFPDGRNNPEYWVRQDDPARYDREILAVRAQERAMNERYAAEQMARRAAQYGGGMGSTPPLVQAASQKFAQVPAYNPDAPLQLQRGQDMLADPASPVVTQRLFGSTTPAERRMIQQTRNALRRDNERAAGANALANALKRIGPQAFGFGELGQQQDINMQRANAVLNPQSNAPRVTLGPAAKVPVDISARARNVLQDPRYAAMRQRAEALRQRLGVSELRPLDAIASPEQAAEMVRLQKQSREKIAMNRNSAAMNRAANLMGNADPRLQARGSALMDALQEKQAAKDRFTNPSDAQIETASILKDARKAYLAGGPAAGAMALKAGFEMASEKAKGEIERQITDAKIASAEKIAQADRDAKTSNLKTELDAAAKEGERRDATQRYVADNQLKANAIKDKGTVNSFEEMRALVAAGNPELTPGAVERETKKRWESQKQESQSPGVTAPVPDTSPVGEMPVVGTSSINSSRVAPEDVYTPNAKNQEENMKRLQEVVYQYKKNGELTPQKMQELMGLYGVTLSDLQQKLQPSIMESWRTSSSPLVRSLYPTINPFGRTADPGDVRRSILRRAIEGM